MLQNNGEGERTKNNNNKELWKTPNHVLPCDTVRTSQKTKQQNLGDAWTQRQTHRQKGGLISLSFRRKKVG
jgi:hypothetical protein